MSCFYYGTRIDPCMWCVCVCGGGGGGGAIIYTGPTCHEIATPPLVGPGVQFVLFQFLPNVYKLTNIYCKVTAVPYSVL